MDEDKKIEEELEEAELNLEEEIEELKFQLQTLINDYNKFTVITNDTISGLIEHFSQYVALFEAMYTLLIKHNILDKAELDQLAQQIYNEMFQKAADIVNKGELN